MKKVGIVTFNDAHNYGAFLQEYALQRFLRNSNIDAKVIDYDNKEFKQLYKYANNPLKRKGFKNKLKILYNIILRPATFKARLEKAKKFEKCCKNEIILSERFNGNTELIRESFDYFVSGSDQVWNVRLTVYNLFYLLDFVQESQKKLSYAASFGRTEFCERDYDIFKKHIGEFKSVLVREKSGQDLLKERCGLNSEVVLDPTFLLNQKDWANFANKADSNLIARRYILIYIVSQPTNLFQAAIKYANERNLDIILVGRNSDIIIGGRKIKAEVNVGPYEFIDYIINSEAIFTTSFHGTILSINLNKPFFYELAKEQYNNNARIIDIIDMLGIENREIVDQEVSDSEIRWVAVNQKLDKERTRSKKLLLSSLKEM